LISGQLGFAPARRKRDALDFWTHRWVLCQPRVVFLASTIPLFAAVVGLATTPDPATKVKPVQVEIDAPKGCANADGFFSSLQFRTSLVRRATADEPRTILQVRLLETRRYVLGELRMVDDRGGTDTRRVQGPNCDDVVQALSLAAAVALDPGVLLHATVTIPAPEATTPANPPPSIAPAVVQPVDVRTPSSPSSNNSRRNPRFELGAASVGSVFLSSSVSPGMAVFGRWTPTGSGWFRPTVGMAFTYLRNDVLGSPGAAEASLSGLIVTICGIGWSASVITVKPCGLAMAGMLSVRGHQVARPSSVDVLWLSAGAAVRTKVYLGRSLSLDLEVGASAPFLRREFYTTLPSNVVEKTPALSPLAGLGLAYGF